MTDCQTEILIRLKAGEEDALDDLILQFYQPLYSYGCCLCADTALVKDSIQDVFLNIWQLRERADTIQNIKYYLITALRRRIIRIISQNRVRAGVADNYGLEMFSADFSIEDLIISRQMAEEKANMLRAIIEQLSMRQKEIIYLIYFQEVNHSQAAELMNISIQSVYNLLHEAIGKLKLYWSAKGQDNAFRGIKKIS